MMLAIVGVAGWDDGEFLSVLVWYQRGTAAVVGVAIWDRVALLISEMWVVRIVKGKPIPFECVTMLWIPPSLEALKFGTTFGIDIRAKLSTHRGVFSGIDSLTAEGRPWGDSRT
jgi:hypothetical protein